VVPGPWALLAGVALAAGATVIVLYGAEAMPYSKGQTVTTKILAPRAFHRENLQRTLALKKQARENTPSVYVFNDALINRIEGNLLDLHRLARLAENYKAFSTEASKQGWSLEEGEYSALRKLTNEAGSKSYERWVRSLRGLLGEEPMVREVAPAQRGSRPKHVLLEGGPRGRLRRATGELKYVSDGDQLTRTVGRLTKRLASPELEKPLGQLIVGHLQPDAENNRFEPVWLFDKKQTDSLLAEAEQGVGVQYDEYNEGDTLVEPGVIDDQEYVLLQTAWRAYREALRTDPQLARQRLLLRAGTAGLVGLIVIGLSVYVGLYQPRVVEKAIRATAMAALLLVMLLLSRLLEMLGGVREWSVLPVVMTGAILTIAYNQRLALGITAAFCVLATMTVNGGMELLLVLLAATGVTVLLSGEIRTRLKILEVGAATGAVAFGATFCVGLTGGEELLYIVLHAGYAALAALAAAVLIEAILPLIEKLFGIVTAMTLLEWCDINRPLLKRLAQETPGTYNHSLVLGSLAEAAAESIGVNGLLVRVGAYYHDIGKINKPDYFVENYESRANRHENLSPTMSLLIIIGHVKDGVELARQYGLPPVLNQFIAEHHGTTVVRYFYHAASEKRQAEGKAAVSESEFRYPGPRPRLKESAILMLSDGAEGAVRALQDPTPGRIEATVHNIAMQRLMDGQLDDCDITLKELARVEESLVKSLCAIYHGRIAYPKTEAQRTPRTA